MERRVNLDIIDLLKVISATLVFFLHVTLFNGVQFAGSQFLPTYPKLFFFYTPAWAGVWIFFLVSGFLAGIGFLNRRYLLERSSILSYYKKKIRNVYFPIIGFLLLIGVLVKPDFFIENYQIIPQIIISMYAGRPEGPGTGATWFIFTLMWLYLFTPLFIFIIQKVKHRLVVLFLLIICGFIYRNMVSSFGLDWYYFTYTSVVGNLDLYCSGICLAYLLPQYRNKINLNRLPYYRFISLISFVGFIVYNSYIYSHSTHLNSYQTKYPTIYLLLVSLILVFFIFNDKQISTPTLFNRCITWFAGISFEFYLFHSLIAYTLVKYINVGNPLVQYLCAILLVGGTTVICSIAFKRIFNRQIIKNKL